MMPIAIFLAMRRQPPGPVGRLVKAGAISPETALKPTTAKIYRLADLDAHMRAGIVTSMPDGRYWVDVIKLRRRRLKIAIVIGIAAAVLAECAWLFLRWVKAI